MNRKPATAPADRPCAQVVRLPLPKAVPGSQAALLTLARYSAAWLRANPTATVDEHLKAAAEIANELGL